ncbi:MAG: YicC family protein [Fusobacteriaceae bacterium]
MRSMTGYSKLRYENDKFSIFMEIKSVNNKNLNLKIKLPYNLNFLENKLRTEISNFITRGSVEVRIEFEEKEVKNNLFQYDKTTVYGCMNILEELEKDFNETIGNKLEILVKNFNVIKKKEVDINEEEYTQFIIPKLLELLKNINEMRSSEGKRLKVFFLEKIFLIEKKVEIINKIKKKVIENFRENFLDKLNKIKTEINFTEKDILKEILIYSDKVDISEELTRIESHLVQMKIDVKNSSLILGKKLDFLLQELFREFNTTGVKCGVYEISKIVVEAKNEIEKMREQALNIE